MCTCISKKRAFLWTVNVLEKQLYIIRVLQISYTNMILYKIMICCPLNVMCTLVLSICSKYFTTFSYVHIWYKNSNIRYNAIACVNIKYSYVHIQSTRGITKFNTTKISIQRIKLTVPWKSRDITKIFCLKFSQCNTFLQFWWFILHDSIHLAVCGVLNDDEILNKADDEEECSEEHPVSSNEAN
jgi:hypothetical protein